MIPCEICETAAGNSIVGVRRFAVDILDIAVEEKIAKRQEIS
jgi:hypothetical protein